MNDNEYEYLHIYDKYIIIDKYNCNVEIIDMKNLNDIDLFLSQYDLNNVIVCNFSSYNFNINDTIQMYE